MRDIVDKIMNSKSNSSESSYKSSDSSDSDVAEKFQKSLAEPQKLKKS